MGSEDEAKLLDVEVCETHVLSPANPCTWEEESGLSKVQGHLQLHRKLKGHSRKPNLENKMSVSQSEKKDRSR